MNSKASMMKNNHPIRTLIFLIALGAVTLTGCHRDNNSPGWSYFPDMAFSWAYETYGSSPNFSDSIHMFVPVEGTVPREMIPYGYASRSFDEQQRAGRELVNPYTPEPEVLARGKEMFGIYCAMCHGESGRGDGHLYVSGLFPAKPTSLRDDYVQSKPDGEIFHIITRGSLSGLMGAQGPMIRPDDRWKIVTYVKNDFKLK
ncbi:MAG: cytochrome c [Bacteroidales bacterium]